MNEDMNTMIQGGYKLQRRRLSVQKVENGYAVNADVIIHVEEGTFNKAGERWESRTFVFSSLSKVLEFVNRYFVADKEELKEGKL